MNIGQWSVKYFCLKILTLWIYLKINNITIYIVNIYIIIYFLAIHLSESCKIPDNRENLGKNVA